MQIATVSGVASPYRFVRSTVLEDDREADVIATGLVQETFKRIDDGLRGTARAWRLVGDYGAGKSTFALYAANRFAERPQADGTRLAPLLVTGTREPLSKRVLKAAGTFAREHSLSLDVSVDGGEVDDQTLEALKQLGRELRAQGHFDGLFLVLDEAGKFLEYAAMRPERQDVLFLQRLAEFSARSGECPLVVVLILHQAVHAYAQRLSDASQAEWTKVAGRYEEILFEPDLKHLVALSAVALNQARGQLSDETRQQLRSTMRAAVSMGWYGDPSGAQYFEDHAAQLAPLHPCVLPAAARLMARYGQNERSVLAFISSLTPDDVDSTDTGAGYRSYGLPELFDYVRANIGHRLAGASYRSGWLRLVETVDALSPALTCEELAVVKATALLNALDAADLRPTREALVVSCGDAALKAIDDLEARGILFQASPSAAGYRLWPASSVSLVQALADAHDAVSVPEQLGRMLGELVTAPSLVARRDYIKRGTLRYFGIRYVDASDFAEGLTPAGADGEVIVVCCNDVTEMRAAKRVARKGYRDARRTVIGVTPVLASLGPQFRDILVWRWIESNVAGLSSDPYAFREVERQLRAAHSRLSATLRDLLWPEAHDDEGVSLCWFHAGKKLGPLSRRQLVTYLSDVSEFAFRGAPIIRSELLNRERLSSAAMKARTRLISAMLEAEGQEQLGLVSDAMPPERAAYLSVLQVGGWHGQNADGGYQLQLPEDDVHNIRPSLSHLKSVFRSASDGRVDAQELLSALEEPPFGVRAGVVPLVVAYFFGLNRHHLAFFERGSFVPSLDGDIVLRMTKRPQDFAVQWCEVHGVRADVFRRVAQLLGHKGASKTTLVDVVTDLCVFAAQLPPYSHKTKGLPTQATAVRRCLLSAQEPASLLFRDLPQACGVESFLSGTSVQKDVDTFVERLRSATEALRNAYPALLTRVREQLASAFGYPDWSDATRSSLQSRAAALGPAVTDITIKALCTRLADNGLSVDEYVASIAAYVVSAPCPRWRDRDEDAFKQRIVPLAARFVDVESLVFSGVDGRGRSTKARLTRDDGRLVELVTHIREEDEETVADLVEQLRQKMDACPESLRAAVATRLTWWTIEGEPS